MRRGACWLCALLLLLGCLPAAASQAPSGMEEIPPVYPVLAETTALLTAARGELGYVEEKSGQTKYGVWMGDPTAQWCAEFLCWCASQAEQALGTSLLQVRFPLYGAKNTGRDWFMAQGRFIARTGFVDGWGTQWYKGETAQMKSNSYVPQPGDWVFFSFTRFGDTTHAAVVEKCLRDDTGAVYVQVIEGNNPDRVQRVAYPLTDWRIQGYGTVYDLADIVLRPGAKGEKVRTLQARLFVAGMMAEKDITGTYGPTTQEAVKAFQSRQGQNQTGIANQQTQLALYDYASRKLLETTDFWTVDSAR